MLVHWTDFGPELDEFERIFRDFDRLFNASTQPMEMAPRFDVTEEDDAWTVHALVPGLGPEDIEVSVKGDVLTISGRRTVEVPEGARALRRERPTLAFSRSLTLGADVDPDGITATVKHGVLRLRLPKRPERKPRMITVTAE